MNPRDYEPPLRCAPQDVSYAQCGRWLDAYHDAFAECMTGCDAVFTMYPSPPNAYDAEQHVTIMAALGSALKRPGATAEQIGTAMLRAVAELANNYASDKADKTTEEA